VDQKDNEKINKPFGPLAYFSNLYENCLDENKGLRHHHEVQGRC